MERYKGYCISTSRKGIVSFHDDEMEAAIRAKFTAGLKFSKGQHYWFASSVDDAKRSIDGM